MLSKIFRIILFVASPEDWDGVWDNIVLLNSKQADTSTIKAWLCQYFKEKKQNVQKNSYS